MQFAWNIQKNTMVDIKGLEMEQDRKGKIKNEEIDIDKTHLNYDLVDNELNLYNRVKNRVEDVRSVSRVQKNSVVDCSNIITVSSEQAEKWGSDKTQDYFREVYKYFCEEFGKENVVSAKVHLDETAPHMHLHFVPVNDLGKLQARTLITPGKLNKVHSEAPKYLMSKGFEVERGEGKTENSLEIKKYKEKMLEEKIKELENEISLKDNKIKSLTKVESVIDDIEKIKVEKKFMSSKLLISESEFNNIKSNLSFLKIENEKLKIFNSSADEKIKNIENEKNIYKENFYKLKNENERNKYNLKLTDEKLNLFSRAVESDEKIENFVFNKMQKINIESIGENLKKLIVENKLDPKFINKILNSKIKIDLVSVKDKNIFDKNILTVKEMELYFGESSLINFSERENINMKFVADKNNNVFNLKLDCENKSFIKQILNDKKAVQILKNEIKNNELKNEINMQKSSKNISKKATFDMDL